MHLRILQRILVTLKQRKVNIYTVCFAVGVNTCQILTHWVTSLFRVLKISCMDST